MIMRNEPLKNEKLEITNGVVSVRDFSSDSNLVDTLRKFNDNFKGFDTRNSNGKYYLFFNPVELPYLIYATRIFGPYEEHTNLVAVVSHSKKKKLQVLEEFKTATGSKLSEYSKLKDTFIQSGVCMSLIRLFQINLEEYPGF